MMKNIKFIFLVIFLLTSYFTFGQNTVTLPTPTTPITPQFRLYNPADTTRQLWVNFPGYGYNRVYTATEISKILSTLSANTFNNGLTQTGHIVGLGGTINSNTTIDVSNALVNWTGSNGTTSFELQYGTLMFHGRPNPIFNVSASGSTGSGSLSLDSTGVTIGSGGGSIFAGPNGVEIDDNNSIGAFYGGHYTSSNPYWLTSKEYVDAAITSGVSGAGFEQTANKTATQSSSAILYPNWLGVTNYALPIIGSKTLTINSTSATTTPPYYLNAANGYGNSIMFGVGASVPANDFLNLVSTYTGLSFKNNAIGGNTVADQVGFAYSTPIYSNSISLVELGTNEQFQGVNANALTVFQQGHEDLLAWLAIPKANKVLGTSTAITYSGTWAATTAYGIGMSTNVTGSTATMTLSGTNVLVSMIQLNSSLGTYTVSIDGSIVGTYSSAPANPIDSYNGLTYEPRLLVYTGLSNAAHTVVITCTSNNNYVFFDWAAGVGGIGYTGGPAVYVNNLYYMSSTGYTNHGGSTANTDSYNSTISSEVTQLSGMGLGVVLANVNTTINPSTDLISDGVHPTDAGHAKIAVVDESVINPSIANPFTHNDVLNLSSTFNNGLLQTIKNTSNGTGAAAGIALGNDANSIGFLLRTSSGFTNQLTPNTLYEINSGDIAFQSNGSEAARISSTTGNFNAENNLLVNKNTTTQSLNVYNPGTVSQAVIGSSATGGTHLQLYTSQDAGGQSVIQSTSAIGSTFGNLALQYNGGTTSITGVTSMLGQTIFGTSNFGYINTNGQASFGTTPLSNYTLTIGKIGSNNSDLGFNNGSQNFDLYNNASVFGIYDATGSKSLLTLAKSTGILTIPNLTVNGVVTTNAGVISSLPFDSTPTSASTNPVTSGGVFTALALKAPLASPALTGTPTTPTAAPLTGGTQISSQAYADNAVSAATVIPTNSRVIPFGDSHAAYGNDTGNPYFDSWGYTTQFDLFSGGQLYQPINLGVAGNTTVQMLARLGVLLAQKPKLVLLNGGGNDIAVLGSSASAIETNMLEIIQAIQATGAKIILQTIPERYSPNAFTSPGEVTRASVNAYYLTLASSSIKVINWDTYVTTSTLLQSDGIHLNSQGAAIIGQQNAIAVSSWLPNSNIAGLITSDNALTTNVALSGTTGSLNTATGSVATSWTLLGNNAGGATVVGSKTTDGGLNQQVITISGATSGVHTRAYAGLISNFPITTLNAGDITESILDFGVASTLTNVAGVSLSTTYNGASGYISDSQGYFPIDGLSSTLTVGRYQLRGYPFVVPAGVTNIDCLVQIYLTDGTSLTVSGAIKIYTAGIRKVAISDNGLAGTVQGGGTGLSAFTPYTLLAGGTTANGQLQQIASTGTAGQQLTSNGPGLLPTFQSPGGVTSITGTANEIIASGSTGAITLSTPQAIGTGSFPQFAGLGIGVASDGVNALKLRAGTASGGPLLFTSGTDKTSIANGLMEYNGTRLAFTPAGTRLRVALTDDVAPTLNYIPVGNGTNWVTTAPTGSGAPVEANYATVKGITGTFGNTAYYNTPTGASTDSVATKNAATGKLGAVPISNFITSISHHHGTVTLVAGVATVSVTGLTTSSAAYGNRISAGGTISTTVMYQFACTANTITITAQTGTGATDTTDTSTVSYGVDQ